MKASILAVVALIACPSAFAQYYHGHPRTRVDFYFGAPYPWYVPPPPPVYYYPPSVVYPPQVIVREAPTVYIEQGEVVAPAPAVVEAQPRQTFEAGYWYYCAERKGYYPTVASCPGTWQKVAPTTNSNR